MEKYNVIILAGGEKGPLYETTGYPNKAMIPIHGKPMLDWVVDAFYHSAYVDNIVVVGPEEVDQLASRRYVRQRLFTGRSIVQNLIHAVAYIKTVLFNDAASHNGYVISFCDAVFLTPEVIDSTLSHIEENDPDVALHYAEKSTFERTGIATTRTYIPIDGKNYTGTVIYYIKKWRFVLNFITELAEMRKHRKDPMGILRVIGCENKNFSEIEQTLSERLSARVRIFISRDPEMGMDIDKPSDLEFAKHTLRSPWRHTYQKVMLTYNPEAVRGKLLSPFVQYLLGVKQRKFELYETPEGYVEKIQEYLSEYGISPEVQETKSQGHATLIAKDCAAQNYDLVIAAGGDGTINEVINGLAGSKLTLGVIPLGTGNVFSLQMRLPLEIHAACQVIASGNTNVIDLGKTNDRYFACMTGIGFDAYVVKEAESRLKKVYGGLSYLFVAVSRFFFYRFRQIVIKIDDQPIDRKGYFVFIANGKYYGGEMVIATRADYTDGYLDVCVFKKKNAFSVLGYLFGMRWGKIASFMNMEYFHCKKISVLKTGSHPVHVDAEYLGKTPVDIIVCPAALKVAI